MTLISTLSTLVTQNSLLEISELEQSLACTSNQQLDLKLLLELLGKPIKDDLKIRLVMLYALRYEKHTTSSIPLLIDTLNTTCGIDSRKVSSIYTLLSFAGSEKRLSDLYGEDVVSRTKQLFKGVKGAENVYTQHKSHVLTLLEGLSKGKSKEGEWLSFEDIVKEKAQDVILFFVGGVTYGECRDVEGFRAANPGMRVLVYLCSFVGLLFRLAERVF